MNSVSLTQPRTAHRRADAKSRQWLIGWSSVCRERLLTGDPSALPASHAALDEDTGSGARRSSPSNLPGIQEVYLTIECAIRPEEKLLRFALEAKYVHGFDTRISPDSFGSASDAPLEEEFFDIQKGLPSASRYSRNFDPSIVTKVAALVGASPLSLLTDTARRFERITLPSRAGW